MEDVLIASQTEDLSADNALKTEGTESALIVKGLKKTYSGRPVVRGVDLTVKRGEAVGLLGPNGAGKTTCFYMITGLVKADAGEVALNGVNLSEYPIYERAKAGIGYLPQESSVFKGLNAEENILAVLEACGVSAEERDKKTDALMREFSIEHLRKAPVAALSGGERRRLEIARALATDPVFLLLDEPFAGVDPIATEDIRKIIGHLTKKRNIGVLITDHNVRETLDIIDRGYIIYDGAVLMQGSSKEIICNPEVRRLYLGARFQE